jgi:hypothetical protein
MALPLKDFRLGITESIDLALTASAAAFGQDKAAVAREILQEWADRKRHEHSVYARGLVANGMQPELPGFETEDAGTQRSRRK